MEVGKTENAVETAQNAIEIIAPRVDKFPELNFFFQKLHHKKNGSDDS